MSSFDNNVSVMAKTSMCLHDIKSEGMTNRSNSGNSTTYIIFFITGEIVLLSFYQVVSPARRTVIASVRDGLRPSDFKTFICVRRSKQELFLAGRFAQ